MGFYKIAKKSVDFLSRRPKRTDCLGIMQLVADGGMGASTIKVSEENPVFRRVGYDFNLPFQFHRGGLLMRV